MSKQVKIEKRSDGFYMAYSRDNNGNIVPLAKSRDRAKLRKIYVTSGHEVVRSWS